jgi:RND family efflux transporter MFP subunit
MNQAPPVESAERTASNRFPAASGSNDRTYDNPSAPRSGSMSSPHGSGGGSGIFMIVVVLLAVALVGLFLLGYLPRLQRKTTLAEENKATIANIPKVLVVSPHEAPIATTVELPGAVAALRDTMLFARSNGFVKSWNFDLGDPVEAGALLCEIDVPDINQQLLQSRATLEQSRANIQLLQANLELAKVSLGRQKSLGPTLTPQQDIDAAQAAFDSAKANLAVGQAQSKANSADVIRLQDLVAFGRITAPFSGIITQRYIEVGNLVNSGSGTTNQPLFHLMQIDPILILVDVPQTSAPSIAIGQAATITRRDSRTGVVNGKVVHIANALDPSTRTMRIQISADNHDHRLLPGMYVQTEIKVPATKPLISIGASALLLSGNGTRVAIVTPDHKISFRTIDIDEDNGATLLISSGLSTNDLVVSNPAGRIVEGMQVEPVKWEDQLQAKPGKETASKAAAPVEAKKGDKQ